jgi:hypothetical protein
MIRCYVNKSGELSTPNLLDFKSELLKHREHEVEIEIKRLKRSSKQNKTLHWALTIFSSGLKEHGYKIEMEDLKYELKQRGFFGFVDYETKEGSQRRPKDTHEMTTDECTEAFDRLQQSALSYDIIIPDPDPNR